MCVLWWLYGVISCLPCAYIRGDEMYRMLSATDLLLQELAVSSTHPENTAEGGGSNPDREVMSQTKKQTFFH